MDETRIDLVSSLGKLFVWARLAKYILNGFSFIVSFRNDLINDDSAVGIIRE